MLVLSISQSEHGVLDILKVLVSFLLLDPRVEIVRVVAGITLTVPVGVGVSGVMVCDVMVLRTLRRKR